MSEKNGSMKYDINLKEVAVGSSHGKILAQIEDNSTVLECGCATGYMTRWMTEKLHCHVSIVEYDPECYEKARPFADDGFCGDLMQNEWYEYYSEKQFDYILFADVLEHLSDPLFVIKKAKDLLKDSGKIIVSIPNIAHNDIILKLVDDHFDYTNIGLLDDTHIHFWGRNNFEKFCNEASLKIVLIDGTICSTGASEQFSKEGAIANNQLLLECLQKRPFGEIYQYIFVAQKEEYVREKGIICNNLLLPNSNGGKTNAVRTTVYYDDNGLYSEDRIFIFETNYACKGEAIPITMDVRIPIGCSKVRIDPCEGMPCVLCNLQVIYDGKHLEAIPLNGLAIDDTLLFDTEDPQLEVQLPNTSGMSLHFDATMWLYDVRDRLMTGFRQLAQDSNRVLDVLEKNIISSMDELLRQTMEDTKVHKRAEADLSALLDEKSNKVLRIKRYFDQAAILCDERAEQIKDLKTKEAALQASNDELLARSKSAEQELEKTINANIEQQTQIDDLKTELETLQDSFDKLYSKYLKAEQYRLQAVALCDDRLAQINRLSAEAEALRVTNRDLTIRSKAAEQNYAAISNAFFWKITKPARSVMTGVKHLVAKNDRLALEMRTLKCALVHGPKEAIKRKKQFIVDQKQKIKPSVWPTAEELEQQKNTSFSKKIKFSVLVPLYNTPDLFLREMIESVQAQTYSNWELCLADGSDAEHGNVGKICKKYANKDERIKYKKLEKNLGISGNTNACIAISTGDYIALFDHDDILNPSALYEVMRAICEENADFIYTDESTFHNSPRDAYLPNYKPDYAPDTLRSYNYICHLSVFQRDLLERAGGGFRSEYDGSQDYDMILRLTEQAQHIVHIPQILYYWRSHPQSVASDISAKPYTLVAAKKALSAHLERIGLVGEVMDSRIPSLYHIRYAIQGNPKVSIVIPNKDHIEDLSKCIQSIKEKTSWDNWEIIVVENNSEEEETFEYYQRITETEKRVRVITWKQTFNYSAICNFGAEYADGQYLLLLNNDIEVINSEWLNEMLMFAQRMDVGAVGAMLYYPDDTVQHAGVILGIGGIAGHSHKGFPRGEYGFMGRMAIAQNLSAVTGACMLIRKSVWDEVGGLDESFAVAFNDVDLCMKIRKAGYLIVWTPYAELYHYESKSRGLEDTPEKQKRFAGEIDRFKKKWGKELASGDPYYNPNLTLDREDFGVR